MTFTVEVENELQELISEELTDPNKSRRNNNGKFVFTEKPNTSTRHPYILVSLLDNQKTGFSVGSTDRFHRHRIQVTIRVGKTNKFEVNGEKRKQGYVKNYLAERIDEIVQDNQSRFRNLGDDIYSLLPDSSNPNSPVNTVQTSNDYILRRRRK